MRNLDLEVLQWLIEVELNTLIDIDWELKNLKDVDEYDENYELKISKLEQEREKYIKTLIIEEHWRNWVKESDKWVLEEYDQGSFSLDYNIVERGYVREVVVYLTPEKDLPEDIIDKIIRAIKFGIKEFDKNYLDYYRF